MDDDAVLRETIKKALEAKGVLAQIRAALRAAVFTCVDEQERAAGVHVPSAAALGVKGDAIAQLALKVVAEFLEHFELRQTLSILKMETDMEDEDFSLLNGERWTMLGTGNESVGYSPSEQAPTIMQLLRHVREPVSGGGEGEGDGVSEGGKGANHESWGAKELEDELATPDGVTKRRRKDEQLANGHALEGGDQPDGVFLSEPGESERHAREVASFAGCEKAHEAATPVDGGDSGKINESLFDFTEEAEMVHSVAAIPDKVPRLPPLEPVAVRVSPSKVDGTETGFGQGGHERQGSPTGHDSESGANRRVDDAGTGASPNGHSPVEVKPSAVEPGRPQSGSEAEVESRGAQLPYDGSFEAKDSSGVINSLQERHMLGSRRESGSASGGDSFEADGSDRYDDDDFEGEDRNDQGQGSEACESDTGDGGGAGREHYHEGALPDSFDDAREDIHDGDSSGSSSGGDEDDVVYEQVQGEAYRSEEERAVSDAEWGLRVGLSVESSVCAEGVESLEEQGYDMEDARSI